MAARSIISRRHAGHRAHTQSGRILPCCKNGYQTVLHNSANSSHVSACHVIISVSNQVPHYITPSKKPDRSSDTHGPAHLYGQQPRKYSAFGHAYKNAVRYILTKERIHPELAANPSITEVPLQAPGPPSGAGITDQAGQSWTSWQAGLDPAMTDPPERQKGHQLESASPAVFCCMTHMIWLMLHGFGWYCLGWG